MEHDLEELTRAAARGERAALDRLLEHYLPELRAFVRLRAGAALRARESSSDIVQSVCRQVLQEAQRFRHANEGAFRRWLFTTAMRKIAHRAEYHQALRRDARGLQALESHADDEALATCYRGLASPSRVAAAKEEIERVEAAFDRLDPEERDVIVEAHLLGRTRAEIAERLGKSEGAVRV